MIYLNGAFVPSIVYLETHSRRICKSKFQSRSLSKLLAEAFGRLRSDIHVLIGTRLLATVVFEYVENDLTT